MQEVLNIASFFWHNPFLHGYDENFLMVVALCHGHVCCAVLKQLRKGSRILGTAFPNQMKRKTEPNNSNKVSIRLPKFPHCIFLFHCSATVLYTRSCHLFTYTDPGAARRNWSKKYKSSSNVTSAKRCRNAFSRVSTPLHPWLYL